MGTNTEAAIVNTGLLSISTNTNKNRRQKMAAMVPQQRMRERKRKMQRRKRILTKKREAKAIIGVIREICMDTQMTRRVRKRRVRVRRTRENKGIHCSNKELNNSEKHEERRPLGLNFCIYIRFRSFSSC